VIRFEPLLRQRRAFIAIYVLLALVAAPGLLRLRVDNSPERFQGRDAAAVEHFQTLERSFGRDRGVRVVLQGDGLWTSRGLAWLAELEDKVQKPGGVYGAMGPVTHHRWHLDKAPAADPEGFRRLLLHDSVDRQSGWVSDDGAVVTVLVGLFKMTPDRRERTLSALEEIVATAPPGVKAGLVGIPVVNRALDEAIRTMAERFFPLLLAAAIGLLWLFFRSLAGILLPLALVGMTETVLLGTMGYSGDPLDVVTVLLVPLVFVVALATGVHIVAFDRMQTASDPVTRVAGTYRAKAWPVLWTGLTTAAGFGSLSVSGVPAVRSLGLWAGFGFVFLTLVALSFYPALLASVPGRRTGPASGPGTLDAGVGRWAERGGRWSIAHRGWVGTGFALVAVLAVLGLFRLEIETNILTYFRPEHPVRAKIEALEREGIGVVTGSLVLESTDGFASGKRLEALRALAGSLREEPLVVGALGLGDLVANVERYLPAGHSETGRSTLELIEDHPDLQRLRVFLLHRDGERTRIVFTTPMRGFEQLHAVYDRAEATAQRFLPETRSYVAGQYPLILAGQRTLLRTMVLSLSFTLIVILTILILLAGDLSLAVRAVVPNLWPVLFVVGAMGWLGIPVESGTVMIASIVLGLAVDDTLHILAHYRRRASEVGPAEGVTEALGETGAGVITSSLILGLGFGVCGLSSLVPVARFGVLSSLGILAALVADLWLVPALFATYRAPAHPGSSPGA